MATEKILNLWLAIHQNSDDVPQKDSEKFGQSQILIRAKFSRFLTKLEPTEVEKKFKACQDEFGSRWLNVVSLKNLELNLTLLQNKNAIALRPSSK